MAAKRVVTPKSARNSIRKNWSAAVVRMWRVPKCVPSMAPIFSNTNVATVARWRCFSASAPHTFATPAMTISNVSRIYQRISYHNVRLARKLSNCWATSVPCTSYIHQRVRSSRWGVVCVATRKRFSMMLRCRSCALAH